MHPMTLAESSRTSQLPVPNAFSSTTYTLDTKALRRRGTALSANESDGILWAQHVAVLDARLGICLLYTSDAADDLLCVDLRGRRILKKTKKLPNI